MFKFFLNTSAGRLAGKFGGSELAGGKIERGKSDVVADGCHGGEKVVFFGVEGGVGGGAGSDDAGHFAADEFLGEAGVFNLFANSDLETAADQLGDVAFGGMIRYAAHRDVNALFLVAGSQGDLELAGGQHGIVEEQFVEIAEAEEQKSVGMLFLNGGVLAHQRRGGIGHKRSW